MEHRKTKILLLVISSRIYYFSRLKPTLKKRSVPKWDSVNIFSLAANIDNAIVRKHELGYLPPKKIPLFLKKEIKEFKPDIIGISSMTPQYHFMPGILKLIKKIDPSIYTVIGGYHPSLMYKEICNSPESRYIDFIVRGEGELTFNELTQSIRENKGFKNILGISYNSSQIHNKDCNQKKEINLSNRPSFIHNEPRPLAELSKIKLPDRRKIPGELISDTRATIETTRGCVNGCKFCSIRRMYGRKYREYSLERVIQDLKNIKNNGFSRVFFCDDNILINKKRLMKLFDLIIENKLNTMDYLFQASVNGIANDELFVKKMRLAGINEVFLAIESISPKNREFLGKEKYTNAKKAVSLLRKHKICIIGGFIVGNPDDDESSIKNTFKFCRKYGVDLPVVQILTPYPKTELREELIKKGLVVNKTDFSRYNGFMSNVRTNHLSSKRLAKIIRREYVYFLLYSAFNPFNAAFRKYKLMYHLALARILISFMFNKELK
jgi:anaerobic magnesium-protoporphyrin IX monomethyl ester cyclase